MRIARVNISMPDDLHRRAQQAGLNISRLAQHAVGAELERLSKIEELDAYLAEMEAEMGPLSGVERAEASDWADRILDNKGRRNSA